MSTLTLTLTPTRTLTLTLTLTGTDALPTREGNMVGVLLFRPGSDAFRTLGRP